MIKDDPIELFIDDLGSALRVAIEIFRSVLTEAEYEEVLEQTRELVNYDIEHQDDQYKESFLQLCLPFSKRKSFLDELYKDRVMIDNPMKFSPKEKLDGIGPRERELNNMLCSWWDKQDQDTKAIIDPEGVIEFLVVEALEKMPASFVVKTIFPMFPSELRALGERFWSVSEGDDFYYCNETEEEYNARTAYTN